MKRSSFFSHFLLSIAPAMLASSAAAQDFAAEQLASSPRHHEWVKIAAGERRVTAFVAYPERSDPAPVVIVIHENRGLTDWVRAFADQLAARGVIAIAPDLLSDFDDTRHSTRDFASSDAAREALYQLPAEQIERDLTAVQRYASALPAAGGAIAAAGFCWGGSQTFRFATASSELDAALVFYGSPPAAENALAKINAPVYGFYGGADQRINATIDGTAESMKKLGKIYQYEIYPGAGHAFMRRGEDPADPVAANREAVKAAWPRIERILDSLD